MPPTLDRNDVSVEEGARGALLALANGTDLIEEAQILYAAERHARAFALAVLAMEEFGKIPRLLTVDRYKRDGRMRVWWKYFRSHETKSGLNSLVAASEQTEDDETWDSMPENWHLIFSSGLDAVKLRALYVDWEDGKFVSPNEIEDIASLADTTIGLALGSLELHQRHLQGLTPELHAANRERQMEIADMLMNDPSKLEEFLAGRGDHPAAKALRRMLKQHRHSPTEPPRES